MACQCRPVPTTETVVGEPRKCGCMDDSSRGPPGVDWGSDTCDICQEESWLTMVLFEPVRAILDDEDDGAEGGFARHPTQDDEVAIAVCSQCLGESLERLAKYQEIEVDQVAFNQAWKYLVYEARPDYASRVFSDEVGSFEDLSQG